jgi:hypothetical protein
MSDDSPSRILVEEVRLGLFRIYWEIEEAMWEKEDVYKQQFELCGSQQERKYQLNFELQLVGNKMKIILKQKKKQTNLSKKNSSSLNVKS